MLPILKIRGKVIWMIFNEIHHQQTSKSGNYPINFILKNQANRTQMSNPQIQSQLKVNHIIANLHKTLSSTFVIPQNARDLQPDENQILSELHKNQIPYQNLVGILAIDTYVNSVVQRFKRFEDIQAILSIHIENVLSLQRNHDKNFAKAFKRVISSVKSLQSAHENFSPESSHSKNHQKMLEHQKSSPENTQDTLILRLRQQNTNLKQRLNQYHIQINELQNKLTNLLKEQQNQFSESDIYSELQIQRKQDGLLRLRLQQAGETPGSKQNISSEAFILLREQLYQKQIQIQKMNEEFSFQMEKYNTVFFAMKTEINELRSYSNLNYIKQIEFLETQIIKMRQQRDRDEIIIQSLKGCNIDKDRVKSAIRIWEPEDPREKPKIADLNWIVGSGRIRIKEKATPERGIFRAIHRQKVDSFEGRSAN